VAPLFRSSVSWLAICWIAVIEHHHYCGLFTFDYEVHLEGGTAPSMITVYSSLGWPDRLLICFGPVVARRRVADGCFILVSP
jgi:hypothetical protein